MIFMRFHRIGLGTSYDIPRDYIGCSIGYSRGYSPGCSIGFDKIFHRRPWDTPEDIS
jgi:hypothetical protein